MINGLLKKNWFSLSATKFSFIFAAFLLIAYNIPFAQKLWRIEPSALFVLCGLLCAFFLFCISTALLFNKYTAKPISILLCIINAFVLYFMVSYNTPIDKVMLLNVIQTDVYEVQDLLSFRMLTYFLLLGLLPSLFIIKTQITYGNFKQELLNSLKIITGSAILCGIIMLSGYQATDNVFHNHRDTKYYLSPVNYIGASLSVAKMRRKSNHPFVIVAPDAELNKYWKNNKKNLFVFVVGETARAANFSLGGYHRPTNTPLEKHMNDIIYYSDTTACGTSTAVSLPCMFSPYGRKDFKIGSEEYTENMLDILDKNGYKVLWRENNTGCKNNCDRVEIEDFCTKKTCLDEILLTDFAKKIQQNEENTFVVMHQTGSHGPAYFEHYPKEIEQWSPVCTTENLGSCSKEELINVYDNTVYYTSIFLSNIMDELNKLSDKYNVALIYASDHGESLGENGIYLHAQPYDTAPSYQKQIPMLIWLPNDSAKAFGIDMDCMKKAANAPHSHDNLFHSALGLAGIKTNIYNKTLDIFAACKKN